MYTFGQGLESALPEDEPECEIKVKNPSFWLRLAAMRCVEYFPHSYVAANHCHFTSDLGFAEAYMYGDITISSLFGIFSLFILNKPYLSFGSASPNAKSRAMIRSQIPQTLSNNFAYYFVTLPQVYLNASSFIGSLSNTRRNISAHYDISNEMFANFLSDDMTYSCGVWKEEDLIAYEEVYRSQRLGRQPIHSKRSEPINTESWDASSSDQSTARESSPASPPWSSRSISATDSFAPKERYLPDALFDAQIRKLHLIIKKADIKKGHRVLEIGTGN